MKDADTTWALVVGIDVYDQVKHLKGPVRDAVAVVGWLRQLGVTDERILLHASPCRASQDLLDDVGIVPKGCTQHEIWASLSTLLDNSGSRLFVFLLGHGYYLFDGGPVFLTKEADANAATNFGIEWLSDLLRARNYQSQFILMDGCLNYAYAGSQRPTIGPGEYSGAVPGAALPSVSQWFGYAASQGEVAAEPGGRGLFTMTLLAALDPSKPDPLCTTIDDTTGAYQLDLDKAISDVVNPAVVQQIPTQRPGIRRLDTGSAGNKALVATITATQTVALRTLVDPMTAVPDVDNVTLASPKFVWKRRVPAFPGSELTLPLTTVLPTGLQLTGWCEMKSNTEWADPDVETVTTGTGNDVVFKLNRGPRGGGGAVTLTTVVDDAVVDAMNSEAVAAAMKIIAGPDAQGKLWLSPSPTGGILYAPAGEEHHLDSVAQSIAEAIDRHTAKEVRAKLERQELPPVDSKPRWLGWILEVDLDPERAQTLGGFLAEYPLVQIGDLRQQRSLLRLADRRQIAIDELAPAHIVLDLPWGRWVTIVEPPAAAGGTSRVVFPDDVGFPPVRNRLRENVLKPGTGEYRTIEKGKSAFVLAVATTDPGELHMATDDLANRLLSGDDRTDDWPAVGRVVEEAIPGGPHLYQYAPFEGSLWPIGKLDVGTASLFFPMAYPNLAFDDRIAPRIEPLSLSISPLWDLLVSAGRLEPGALDARGVNSILRSGEPLLMLAGMYGCYVNGLGRELGVLQEYFPEDSADPDVVILRHANAMKFLGAETASELPVNFRGPRLAALATDGRVPVFKWGLGVGQKVAQHFDVPALATKLKRIEDRMLTTSTWTLWRGNQT